MHAIVAGLAANSLSEAQVGVPATLAEEDGAAVEHLGVDSFWILKKPMTSFCDARPEPKSMRRFTDGRLA